MFPGEHDLSAQFQRCSQFCCSSTDSNEDGQRDEFRTNIFLLQQSQIGDQLVTAKAATLFMMTYLSNNSSDEDDDGDDYDDDNDDDDDDGDGDDEDDNVDDDDDDDEDSDGGDMPD